MKVTLQQTEKLFLERNLNFKSLGFSMLVTNLKTFHAKAPSKYTLEECNSAINSFLNRFKDIMASDYEIIAKL